ncbi:MAG: 4Fe-4S dicluster domain-containing protein [Kiritimatiellae bacterium]|nr:4Fe-4S dicluster domain-containing protein [Kiritimatiellia bacterium]
MHRPIQSISRELPGRPERLLLLPDQLVFPLDARTHRGAVQTCVRSGETLGAGQVIAEGEWQTLHPPLDGVGTEAEANRGVIRPSSEQTPMAADPMPLDDRARLPDYLRLMGLVGMGGGCFPYARRLARLLDKPPHTLVINAVECEPGIGIDESLMLHEKRFVLEAVNTFTRLLGMKRTVLAVRRSARGHLETAWGGEAIDWLEMSDTYPGGAGKLISAKLTGHMPQPGTLNSDLGILITNVASLRAFGKRLLEGCPSVDRPLTLLTPNASARQLLVPLGISAGDVLRTCGVTLDAERQVLVAEGRMMGRAVELGFCVGKGTNALMVLNRESRWERPEQPCILCGSCFDACPLTLHPIGMANRIRAQRRSRALEAQLNTCFLCGACSAVCPVDIPLVQIFREGKQWLRKNS